MVTRDEMLKMAQASGLVDLYPHGLWIDAHRPGGELDKFFEMAFEAGRQQGMKQERALWQLAKTSQEIERGEV